MTLKELLNIAKDNLEELSSVSNPDFRLEQAEFDSEKKTWEIVVSYLVENTNKRNNPITAFTSEFQYHRIYKKVIIDDNKQVIGFYMFNNKE